jgi:two-component sensor histidine kinase
LRPITGDDDRITLKADIGTGILVDADTAVPLGIVLTELVTNAVTYGFPAPRLGTILVQARRQRSERFEMVVQDNGIGMSSLREGPLGYSLIRSLVQQIRGEIEVRSDTGLMVTITFPEAARESA